MHSPDRIVPQRADHAQPVEAAERFERAGHRGSGLDRMATGLSMLRTNRGHWYALAGTTTAPAILSCQVRFSGSHSIQKYPRKIGMADRIWAIVRRNARP